MPEFRIQRCLGRGGFGEVYKGVMTRGNGVEVDVAIKVLRSDLDPESQGVQRLRDEGRLLGRMTHPSILRVYDLVVIDGHAALVSEYIAGDDLARILREQPLPPRPAFEMVAQVAAALEAAWSSPSVADGSPLHLVHRDIKPDNIRLDPFGTVKLLDFGLAQASRVRREAHTSVNTIMGSTQYLSPERLVQQEVGPEADVFALGATAFEALTGEGLFARKSMRQMYLLMIDDQRFTAYVEERTASRADKLGGPEGVALVRESVAWDKRKRPTAGDLATRCDTLADSLSGANLRSWCRNRTWSAPADTLTGPLEGLTFVTTSAGPSGGGTPHTQRLRAPSAGDPPTENVATTGNVVTAGLEIASRPDPDPTPAPEPPRVAAPEPSVPLAPPSEGPSPWTPEERAALAPAIVERSQPVPRVAEVPAAPTRATDGAGAGEPHTGPTHPPGPPPVWPEPDSTSDALPTQQLRAVEDLDALDEPSSTARLPLLERQRSPELWPLPMAVVSEPETARTDRPPEPGPRLPPAALVGPEGVPTVRPARLVRSGAEPDEEPGSAATQPRARTAGGAEGEGGSDATVLRNRRPRLRSDGTAAPRRRLTRTSSGEAVREITDEVPRSALEPTLSGPAVGRGQEETLSGHEPTWPALRDPEATPARAEALAPAPMPPSDPPRPPPAEPPRPPSLPPRPPSLSPRPPSTPPAPAPPSARGGPPSVDEVPSPRGVEDVLEAMEATTGSLRLGTGLHGARPPAEDAFGPDAPTRVGAPAAHPARPTEAPSSSSAATIPEQPAPRAALDPPAARPRAPDAPARPTGASAPTTGSAPPAARDDDPDDDLPGPGRRAPPAWTRLVAGAGGGLAAIALGVGFLLFVLLVLVATRP